MKVWWCLEHNLGDGDPTLFRPGQEVVACFVAKESYKYGRDCRMVPMRLILDDAETVERIIEGLRGRTGSAYSVMAAAVLEALTGETP